MSTTLSHGATQPHRRLDMFIRLRQEDRRSSPRWCVGSQRVDFGARPDMCHAKISPSRDQLNAQQTVPHLRLLSLICFSPSDPRTSGQLPQSWALTTDASKAILSARIGSMKRDEREQIQRPASEESRLTLLPEPVDRVGFVADEPLTVLDGDPRATVRSCTRDGPAQSSLWEVTPAPSPQRTRVRRYMHIPRRPRHGAERSGRPSELRPGMKFVAPRGGAAAGW